METLNDYELLEYINSNNEEAHNLMFEKYKPLIISIAKKNQPSALKYGYDINDLIQEGMIGLSKAINSFNSNMNVKFYTLAKVCIERRIIDLFIKEKREKYRVLNESIPILDDNYDLENIIINNCLDPLNIVLENDNESLLFDELYKLLSKQERQVLDFRKQGFNNIEIAKILDKDRKQIDNTIHRIKQKYQKIKENI